jgi:hypothetical protein
MAIELYIVNLLAGNVGVPGAPILHLGLAVNAPTGHITGRAEVTQAVAPPNGIIQINDLRGRIHSLEFGPKVRVVELRGSYIFAFPPPAIGEGVALFSATFIIGQDNWNGRGSFTFGSTEIDDVPFRVCEE